MHDPAQWWAQESVPQWAHQWVQQSGSRRGSPLVQPWGAAVGAQERLWAEPHAGPMPPIIENEKRNLGPPLIANSSIYFV